LSVRRSGRLLAIVLAIVVSGARAIELSAEPAAPAERLRVCLLEDDAPRAHRVNGRGFDLDVMTAVAGDAGAAIEVVWAPSRSGFSEIEASDLPLGRLARGECDAVASVPGSDSLGRLRERLALSRPYYGAAFELVAAPDGPSTFAALRGKRVGAQLQSFAHLAAQSLGLDWRVRPSPRETLELLDTGEVVAVLVWGPALAPLGRAPDQRWNPPRALRWNEHVAVRRGSPWLPLIDRALERLEADGTIERLEREHGIPVRAPFATVSDASALAELRRENEAAAP
jgi:polar amino acid transport system substrate-binding protein